MSRALALLGVATLGFGSPQQPPQFRAEVDLVRIESYVVDKNGAPIVTLTRDDFEVSFNYKPRRIVSVQFVRYDMSSSAPATKPTDRDGATKALEGRRIFVLAIDESSFRVEGGMAAVKAATRFIEHLQPNDVVGIYRYPLADPQLTLVTDHREAIKALDGFVGRLMVPESQFHLSASEVVDLNSEFAGRRGGGGSSVLQRVVQRECPPTRGGPPDPCGKQVQAEAVAIAGYMEAKVAQSLAGLRGLLESISGLPVRKTVVVISGGLMAGDTAGSRPDISLETTYVGELAARSNVNLYVMHLDSSFDDMFSADRGRNKSSVLRDDMLLGLALDHFADAGGGALFRIRGGLSDFAFDRVLRETSAYYLLGVEPEEADRDGRVHNVQVKTKVKGVEVRARAQVVIPKKAEGQRS